MTATDAHRNEGRALFLAGIVLVSVIAIPISFAGIAAADQHLPEGADVDVSDGTESAPILTFHGHVVYSDDGNVGGDVQLRRGSPGDSTFVSEIPAEGGNVTFDTTDLEPGSYFLRSGGADHSFFEVVEQQVRADFADDEVDNRGETATTTVDWQSNRGGTFDVRVTAEELSTEELADVFDVAVTADDEVVLEGVSHGDSTDANFTDVDPGTYNLTFNVTDTTTDETSEISVAELAEGDSEFTESSYIEQRGDVAEIAVNFTGAADSGTVILGDEETVGYELVLDLEDGSGDGAVTVLFNTYAAGNASMEDLVVNADDDGDAVEVVSQTQFDDESLLDAGDYEMIVSPGNENETRENAQDVSVLVLDERSTDDLQLWTAAPETVDEIDSEGDLATAAEAGLVVEGNTVAAGDVLVIQLNAGGLSGVLGTYDGSPSEQLQAAIDDGAITLEMEQTEESTQSNREPKTLNTSDLDVDAVVGDDAYYLVMDTSEFTFERDGSTGFEAEGGEEYDVSIGVADERLLNGDEPEDHRVNATVGLVDRDVTFGDETVQVEADAEQTVVGATNIAPGHELTLRLRSGEGTEPRFIMTEDVIVQGDGTFEGTFDFSDQSEGDTFTVRVRGGDLPDVKAEGEVTDGTNDTDEEVDGLNVSELEPTDVEVQQGEVIDVSATITNTGDEELTQSVELRIDGNSLATQEITLEPNESTTVTFEEVDTSELEPGEYEHGIYTDDDEETGTIVIGDDGETPDGETPEDETPEDETPEETPADHTPGDETPTEDGTPGFGIGVALFALVAAALLAARRQRED